MQTNRYHVTPNTISLTLCLRYNDEMLGDKHERIKHAMGITVDMRREMNKLALVDPSVARRPPGRRSRFRGASQKRGESLNERLMPVV